MDSQPETVEPFGEHSHYPPCIFFVLAANNKVVSKPYDEAVSLHPWLDIPDKPVIQYMVKIDVRQHRGNDAPNANDNFCFDRVVKYVRAGKKT